MAPFFIQVLNTGLFQYLINLVTCYRKIITAWLRHNRLAYSQVFNASLTLCLLCAGQLNTASASTDCRSSLYDETARVKYVYDGDTVILKDGRKVRLIGINTPEMSRDGQAAQAYAQAARDQLRALIKQSQQQVKLRYGKDPRDHYGRQLAHLFNKQGDNLQSKLLAQGLAVAITYPPNDHFSSCYQLIEALAQCRRTGLWSHPDYRIIPATQLNPKSRGYRLITARVKTIRETSKGISITLENGLIASIRQHDLANFDKSWLADLKNQALLLRGWIHPAKSPDHHTQYFMRLRHPSSISLISDNDAIKNCDSLS